VGEKSNIGWTDSTWNPVVGCLEVSPGCTHCYAASLHTRFHEAWKRGAFDDAPPQYHKPFREVQLIPERLGLPLRWTKPRMIFVNSLSDLFHTDVPDEFISEVFATMAATPRHTYQILTKRPARMRQWCDSYYGYPSGDPRPVLPNVWLGASVERQREADERIGYLLGTPAAVRFLSCEPLLGPLDLTAYFVPPCPSCGRRHLYSCEEPDRWGPFSWVIVGGESGAHLREERNAGRRMRMVWARDIRDQCVAAGVPLYFKQQSDVRAGQKSYIEEIDGSHTEWHQFPQAVAR
jgi:protein gp37